MTPIQYPLSNRLIFVQYSAHEVGQFQNAAYRIFTHIENL